jgi:predicted dehydrogenase
VGVADPVADPSDVASRQGIPFVRDYVEMLDQVRCDAVIIATPNDQHVSTGVECARRGLHVLVEKPIADTAEAAALLVAEARKAGVKLLVGHHRRYAPAIQKARSLVAEGRIGRPVGASVVWATRKPDDYFNVAWRRRSGGGPVLINLIHEIDNLRYLCGEIGSVLGIATNGVRGFEVEDTAGAILHFESGTIATVLCSDAAVSPWTIEQGLGENPAFAFTGQNSCRIVGTEGALEVPNLVLWNHRDENDIGWNRPLTAIPVKIYDRDPWIEQLKHFCAVIQDNVPPISSGEDGMGTLVATLAVLESSRTGKPVDIATAGTAGPQRLKSEARSTA